MEATNLKSKQNRKFFDTQEMNKEKAVEHRPKKQWLRLTNGVGNSVIELEGTKNYLVFLYVEGVEKAISLDKWRLQIHLTTTIRL